jgi:hypothetical protein
LLVEIRLSAGEWQLQAASSNAQQAKTGELRSESRSFSEMKRKGKQAGIIINNQNAEMLDTPGSLLCLEVEGC